MKKLKDLTLEFLQSDVFAVCAGVALVYGYIKASLVIIDYFVR